jgi:hypothetical protein
MSERKKALRGVISRPDMREEDELGNASTENLQTEKRK